MIYGVVYRKRIQHKINDLKQKVLANNFKTNFTLQYVYNSFKTKVTNNFVCIQLVKYFKYTIDVFFF